jgi:hypothetical protein
LKKAAIIIILTVFASCGQSVRVDEVPLAGAWLRGTKTVVVVERSRVVFAASNGATNFGRLSAAPEGAYRIVEDTPPAEYLAAFFPAAAVKAIASGAETFGAGVRHPERLADQSDRRSAYSQDRVRRRRGHLR